MVEQMKKKKVREKKRRGEKREGNEFEQSGRNEKKELGINREQNKQAWTDLC